MESAALEPKRFNIPHELTLGQIHPQEGDAEVLRWQDPKIINMILMSLVESEVMKSRFCCWFLVT